MIDDYIHYYCVYTVPSAPKFMYTDTEYMRPRVSKELFLLDSEKLPLWHFAVAHN